MREGRHQDRALGTEKRMKPKKYPEGENNLVLRSSIGWDTVSFKPQRDKSHRTHDQACSGMKAELYKETKKEVCY